MIKPPDDPKAAALRAIMNPIHARAYEAFFNHHLQFWQNEHAAPGLDPLHLQIAEMGALLRVAAALAVDAGMPRDSFLRTAQESYLDAFNHAPKWS